MCDPVLISMCVPVLISTGSHTPLTYQLAKCPHAHPNSPPLRTGTGTGASTSTMYTQSQTHLPPSRYCTPAALTEHSIGRDRRAQHSVHSVSLCAVCTLISVRSDLRPYLLSPVRQSVRLPLASPSRPVCLCPAAAGCGSSNFAFRGALKLYDLPLQS